MAGDELAGSGRSEHSPGFAGRAVLRISAIEFWERYSFYNMFALLPLFISAPTAKGGLGWTDAQALGFFGVYLLSVQLAPLIGGYVTDRWLRGGRAITLGSLSLMLGHGLLAMATLAPWLSRRAMAPWLDRTDSRLGEWAAPPGLPASLHTPYLVTTLCFFGAVFFVALGNGLFKPVLSVVVGRLPHASPGARDRAFTTYFLFINMGGILSTLLGGWLSQTLGWGWAFAAAAAGMAVALMVLARYNRAYIRPFAALEGRGLSSAESSADRDLSFVLPVALLLAIVIVGGICSYQSYGFVSLFTARLVDRNVGGFLIPPSWFTAVNPITIMLVTPIVMRWWARGGLGHNWSPTTKYASAFFLMALAFLALTSASVQAHTGAKASPVWIFFSIAIIAVTELIVAPATLSAMSRLPPPGRQNLTMGAYAAAMGVGAWLSGKLGAGIMGPQMTPALGGLIGVCITCGTFLVLLRRPLARLGI
jgi:POT family proton-dependent oligopeptide transporter